MYKNNNTINEKYFFDNKNIKNGKNKKKNVLSKLI